MKCPALAVHRISPRKKVELRNELISPQFYSIMYSVNEIFNFRDRVTFVHYGLKYIRGYIEQSVKKICFWIMFGGLTLSNSLIHSLVGNKHNGYRAAVWNCARGLILQDCSASDKFIDIKLYLQKHQLDIFRILECDLHGQES